MKKIILILVISLFSSCASDYYALNKFRNVALPTLVGYRGDNPLSVSLIADDAVLIEENSSTAIREYDVTQYDKSFILKKIKGNYYNYFIPQNAHKNYMSYTKKLKKTFTKSRK